MGVGKTVGTARGEENGIALPYRKSGRVVVVVLGRLGLISLAGGER